MIKAGVTVKGPSQRNRKSRQRKKIGAAVVELQAMLRFVILDPGFEGSGGLIWQSDAGPR